MSRFGRGLLLCAGGREKGLYVDEARDLIDITPKETHMPLV